MRKYRLITRSDFDGLVCAMIFKEMDMIDDILFVHPKDMQDGLIDVDEMDITSNLPFVEGVFLAFDHHASESAVVHSNYINHKNAPSAARVVYEYYGGEEKLDIDPNIIRAVDKSDSADFSYEDIVNPQGWTLLSFIMDSRTGLGRYKNFRISNYDLMLKLIDLMMEQDIDEILQDYDVNERVLMYKEQEENFKKQIQKCSTLTKDIVVFNLKNEDPIYVGNRFMIYALFPEATVSVYHIWGFKKRNTVFTLGRSILNKNSKKDLGMICKKHGGGGHKNAATCQVPNSMAEDVLQDIIKDLES